MPATIKQQTHPNYNRIDIEHLDVAVPNTGLTSLAEIVVAGVNRLFLQVAVSGQALDQFVISARSRKNSPWSVLYSGSADYAVPRGVMIGVSGDLSTLAAGDTGDIVVDVRGFYELRFEARSGNAAGSTVSVFGGAA